MAHPLEEAEYSIAAVSKLTGVSCHALRVWERRYGFPVPHRTPSGHRRYATEQVLVLRRVAELTRSGRPIGEVIADVRGGMLTVEAATASAAGAEIRTVEARVDELLDRLLSGDQSCADACFDRLEAEVPQDVLVTRVIGPALTETGERWFRGRLAVYQERCVSGFLRRRLDTMIEAARKSNAAPGRKVVLGAVQGDRHEGGVLLAHLLLERAGWRVINLGVDLPVREYVDAVKSLRPDALALSFVLSRNINKRFQELSAVRGLPVFVGGRSILNHQGLARRFGLTPIPGPVTAAVESMLTEYESWRRRHGPSDGSDAA